MTALEEALAALELAGRDLHAFHPRGPFAECTIETCTRIRATLDDLTAPPAADVEDEDDDFIDVDGMTVDEYAAALEEQERAP